MAVGLSMLFKILGRRGIPLAAAVPLNYLTCSLTGLALALPHTSPADMLHSDWLAAALIQGLFFYASFSLLGLASQRIGLAVSALFSRIAMTVPVVISFWLLGDDPTLNKICGILATVAAMALLLGRRGREPRPGSGGWLALALALFCLHGIQLSIMNLSQHYYLRGPHMYNAYMALSFCSAFVCSAVVAGQRVWAGKLRFSKEYALAGMVLGLCNYACVYFLISALGAPGWGGGRVFPLFSIGIVGGNAVLARLFFKEKLTPLQWSGLGLGCLAVILLSSG